MTFFSILSPAHYWVRITKIHITYCSPLPCQLISLMPIYSPQHPILKHPQPTFLHQCERPSFTPIQNTGKIIILYLHAQCYKYMSAIEIQMWPL
jgi:hypothetical protein